LDVIKAGNGEAIRVNKTSGSGNAMTIIGGNFEAPTIVKTGGTSAQFLKADGSVDSSTYLTTSGAASVYVPYTGATTSVNLGTNTLSSSNLIANGGFNSGKLLLKNSNAASLIDTGYFTLSPSSNTTTIHFGFSTGASTWKNFGFSSHLIPDNTITLFSLPSGGGTLAVTSDLGAYLPLAGGILTGGLFGTTAQFSGDIQSGTRLIASATSQSIILHPNNAGTTNRIEGVGTLPLALVSGASITLAAGGTTPQITLATNGAVTLTGALGGTSGTFSGTLATTFINVSSASGEIGGFNSSAANGGYITWKTSGTTIADIGTSQQIFGAGGNDTFGINARGARSLVFGTNNTSRVIINSDGSAFFNYPVLGSRSFVFRTLASRPLTLETVALTGIHSLYLRANDSGRHLISSNYLSGGVYLPLALSGRENDADFVLGTNGNVGIGTGSPVAKFEIASPANTYIGSPSITLTDTSGDANSNRWIVGNIATDYGSFNIASAPSPTSTTFTPRLTISRSGNVGIGTTSPNIYNLSNAAHLTLSTSTANYAVITAAGSAGNGGEIDFGNQTIRHAAIASLNGSNLGFYTNGTNSGTGVTERMRLTPEGYLLVGPDTIPGAGSTTIGSSLGGAGFITAQRAAATVGFFGRNNDGELFAFYRGATQVGNISVTSVLTTYNTTSDYRLKEDLQEFNGLEKVQAIKVYDYKWKSQESRMNGVLAHELAEVLPYAVQGEKDEQDEEGNDKMQSVDYSKIVPILIKAIQEQQEQIDSLKNQIQTK
jgi:hypothetical protein